MMEYNERILCGAGEVELDPNIVSEEAGKLYSELQTVIELHGEGVVESLVPIFVWILEGLANCKSQLRDREEEANREKAEKEDLLERYQTEKTLRKESQERYLELDDQIEHERRAMKMREKERERRERQLENKAREQADQLLALEEQKTHLSRELSTLRHTHTKLTSTYREMLDKRKESERESPLRNHVHPKNDEKIFINAINNSNFNEKLMRRPHSHSGPPTLEDVQPKEEQSPVEIEVKPDGDEFINDIITSTPELANFHGGVRSRVSIPVSLEEEPDDAFETNFEDEIRKEQEKKEESNPKEQEPSSGATEEHEDESEEDLEFELRNTDSVFSELSELSRDYLESVDQGASVRGGSDRFEEVLYKYEELKVAHELVDVARKSLISRVVELTDDRSALQLELSSLQETVARIDNRLKEKEEEIKRLKGDLEVFQSADSDASVSTSVRHFSRSEMARVVMEKNQYKQRLVELQEAMRRNQTVRASREERLTSDKSASVWKKFNRLLGLSKEPLIPPPSSAYSKASKTSSTYPSPSQRQASSPVLAESTSQALSPRVRRREHYREIRSHIWGKLGKRQIHGWSVPLSNAQDSQEPVPEPRDVPVLIKLRLLDLRDSTAKMNCAVAVPPEVSGEASCSVWVISGPASSSEITVIDPARPNTVLEQFTLPPTSPALCICAVPPIGDNQGTVWIGTQEGSVLVHSASTSRRRCLQSISFSEAVHSLTFTQNQVIAGLADGTLGFFSPTPGGWDLSSHAVMSLGSTPLQPIRCCLAKAGRMWVGYWNKVHVVDIENRKTEHIFTVSERSEQQVRFLCAGGSGVWTACRLDPILRLYDWTTGRPLQEVDFSALVHKTLGPSFLTLSPLQISSLSIICGRLWIGTGGGAVISIPLSITSEAVSIPYCSIASAQLCYHGHRQAVRFIIPAPSCLMTSPDNTVSTSHLIISGGEGYINFKIGDDANEESDEVIQTTPHRSERSHMIIWQIPSVLNPAL